MTAWVQLAKYGDIVSILPILRSKAVSTGLAQNLVVCRQYSDILDGLGYINPVVFDGHWQDIKGAIKMAKRMFDSVVVLQQYGSGIEFEKRTPSFQLDMWERAGALSKWDSLSHDFPRPHALEFEKPTIVISDHSQSSPFFHKEQMVDQIRSLAPEFSIERIAGVRFSNPLHVLPLFDAAKLVVCVDSSHLHISASTSTPVIAMTADRPTFWHGSAWSKRFAFHCRYGDYQTRTEEFSAAVLGSLAGRPPVDPVIIPTREPHGYNMSVIVVDGSPIKTYRYHGKGWKTKIAIEWGGSDIKCQTVTFPESFDDFSFEDGRLFMFKGRLHIAFVMSRAEYGVFRCVQSYGALDLVDGKWRVAKVLTPRVKGNDFSGMQKNWVPMVHEDSLWFITGSTEKQQCILVDGEKVIASDSCGAPKWSYGDVRGGACARAGGSTVRVFHSRSGDGHTHFRFRYHLGAYKIDPKPPFKPLDSPVLVYAGNEKYTKCDHWKPNCVLPYGLVEAGGSLVASVGLNDCEAAMIEVKL